MRYSVGDSLADYGFCFFEKLHEPIFLVHKNGKLAKVNEAGRKFLRIAHLSATEMAEQIFKRFSSEINLHKKSSCFRVTLQSEGLQLIAQNFENSDFILVEVKKSHPSEVTKNLSTKEKWATKMSCCDE